MEKFKKDTVVDGGTKDHPFYVEVGEYKCIACKIDSVFLSTESKFCSETTGRGKLNTEWDEVTIECPECKTNEKYDTPYRESDGSYYSTSQPDG